VGTTATVCHDATSSRFNFGPAIRTEDWQTLGEIINSLKSQMGIEPMAGKVTVLDQGNLGSF
jgi:hypothetical protein